MCRPGRETHHHAKRPSENRKWLSDGLLILETETRFRKSWPRRQESNLYFTLRRHTFYPLNYGEDLKLRKTKRNASIYITLATDTSASWRMARVASLSGSTSKQAAALPAAAFACSIQ